MTPLRVAVCARMAGGDEETEWGRARSRLVRSIADRVALSVLVEGGRGRSLFGARTERFDAVVVDPLSGPPIGVGSSPLVALVHGGLESEAQACESAWFDDVAAVVVPSQWSAAWVRARRPDLADVVHVAGYGVDTSLFNPDAAVRMPGTAVTEPEHTIVATVVAQGGGANVEVLCEAVRIVRSRGTAARLVVVVDGDEEAARTQNAALRGVIEPIDRRLTDRDLASVLARAAVVCVPSLDAGFSSLVLEAMACGAPVVAVDSGALPEVVGDAGLILASDAAAMAEAVGLVLSSRAVADELSAAGRRRAAGRGWSRAGAQLFAALDAAR